MTPLDDKTLTQWEEIVDRFHRETGMTAALTDGQGKMLLNKGDRFPLCRTVRETPESLAYICSQTNTVMLAEARNTLRPVTDVGEGGLLRVAVPLVREGQVVGQLTACGMAPEGEELDLFVLAMHLGNTEEEVEELARSTPAGSVEALGRVAEKFFGEINPGH